MSFTPFSGPCGLIGTRRGERLANGRTHEFPAAAIRLPFTSWWDSRRYLGRYVRVTAPNGRSAVLPVCDFGPNENSGHNVGLSLGALPLFGYTWTTFATNEEFAVEYAGADWPRADRPLRPRVVAWPSAVGRDGVDGEGATIALLLTARAHRAKTWGVAEQIMYGQFDGGHPSIIKRQLLARRPGDGATSGGESAMAPMVEAALRISSALPIRHPPAADAPKPVPMGRGPEPLDCRAQVLSMMDPNGRRVDSLAKWGTPGEGRRMTIWVDGDQALMEVNGRLLCTYEGRPTWIRRTVFSDAYFGRFTPRNLENGHSS